MKKYKITTLKLTLSVLIITAFFGCIKDGLQECPEGNVRINFYVEQFENPSDDPLALRERIFSERVEHIRYYLYKDGQLHQQDVLTAIPRNDLDAYTFTFNGLGYGNYQMVAVANCTGKALTGNPVNPDNLLLTYPGCVDTEDFFTTAFTFTVDSNDPVTYDVGLLRIHGVIRYRFVNLPSDVSHVGIVMKDVSSEKWITGDYKVLYEASNRYAIIPLSENSPQKKQAAAGNYYEMRTFPSLTDQRSAYYLSLHREGEAEAYLSQMISDTLTVRRNQLLQITATFNEGTFDFDINMDPTWDGPSDGGEIGIQ